MYEQCTERIFLGRGRSASVLILYVGEIVADPADVVVQLPFRVPFPLAQLGSPVAQCGRGGVVAIDVGAAENSFFLCPLHGAYRIWEAR